eukprot:2787143-Alexandrium_andersonii.AAC.1
MDLSLGALDSRPSWAQGWEPLGHARGVPGLPKPAGSQAAQFVCSAAFSGVGDEARLHVVDR